MDSSGYMIERASTGTRTRAGSGSGEDVRTLDDATFRAFYQQHGRAVWSYLYRVLGNASLADDVMQEAFCRFLTAPVADLAESEQRAYVFRIAGNLAIDHWRKAKRERQTFDDHPDHPEPSVPGTQPTPRELDVARTLGDLKPRERALLWLAYVEESGHDEIAQSLGLAPRSVRVLLFRARRKLASLLRQRGISHGGAERR